MERLDISKLHDVATDFTGVVLPNQHIRHCLFETVANHWRSTRNFGGFQLTKIYKNCEISTGALNPTYFVVVPGLKNIENGRSSLDMPGLHQI